MNVAPTPTEQKCPTQGTASPAAASTPVVLGSCPAPGFSRASLPAGDGVPVARRNHPCPCGSGRKHKLCCERKVAVPTASPPTIAEIDLERAFLTAGADMSDYLAHSDAGERVVHVRDVLRQMDAAWRAGVRTLLVAIDSGGGEVEGGILLYDALRTWRSAGGAVVVYVSGLAGSTMSWAILGADLVVARKRACILVHGPSRGLRDEVTAVKRAIYRTETLAPAELVEQWVTTPSDPGGGGVVRLDADAARGFGFVDFVGVRERAREYAEALAHGVHVTSPRRTALQARGELPEFAVVLGELHAAAEMLRRRMA